MSTNSEKENSTNNSNNNKDEEEKDVALPGFRFHPTDEELVSFYLRRKVGKKPISIELIKQIDLYKYDPWDLPSNVGDKEWYFFCVRGRKYKNSIRPNRVTGSGFWKATGIDKPIYSSKEPRDCVGLKKSLVYYRGSAGKGTKTDWMMHEFRLPPLPHTATTDQEAEIWTLCRIFKRVSSYKKYNTNPRDQHDNKGTLLLENIPKKSSSMPSLSTTLVDDSSSKTCSLETQVDLELNSYHHHINTQLFSPCHRGSEPHDLNDHQVQSDRDREHELETSTTNANRELPPQQLYHQAPTMFPGGSSYYDPILNMNPNAADNDFFTHGSWDELRSVVQLADRNSSQLYDKLP